MKKFIMFTIALFMMIWSGSVKGETILRTCYQNSAPKYFERNGKIVGVCVDIIDELNKRLTEKGIKIVSESKIFVPVARRVRDLKEGNLDLFVGMSKRENWQADYQYAEQPIYELKGVFAKSASDPFEYTDEDSLKGKKIASLESTGSAKKISQIEGVTVTETYDIPMALKMLTKNRIDLVYYHNLGLEFNIKEFGFQDQIKLVKKPFRSKHHYIVFSKKVNPDIVAEINKALISMSEDDTLENIMKQYK